LIKFLLIFKISAPKESKASLRRYLPLNTTPASAMASLYNAAAAAGKGKRKATDESEATATPKNKQRVLILPSRGVTMRMRHLVNDLEALLPHSKKGE
jgi:hypothetical protein